MTEKENVQEEMDFGFVASNCAVAAGQIEMPDLESRKMGYNTLVNVTPDSEGYKSLWNMDIFTHIIQGMNDSNLPIIGMVCAAFRNLSQLQPEEAEKYVPELPVEFLLSVADNPEIIDFLSTIISNSFDVSQQFVSDLIASEIFQQKISQWLESSNQAVLKSTLDMFNSIALFNPSALDFSVITPFADAQFPTDIRALALNCVLQTEPSDEALGELIGLLQCDDIGPCVFEVLHDLIQSGDAPFEEAMPVIINKAIEYFKYPAACTLLAEVSKSIDEEQCHNLISQFFSLQTPAAEQCFALFELTKLHQGLITNDDQWIALGNFYAKCNDLPTMELLEFLMAENPDYCISEDAQGCFTAVIKKEFQIALRGFEFAITQLATAPVTEQLGSAIHDFIQLKEDEKFQFEDQLAAKVETFVQNHQ